MVKSVRRVIIGSSTPITIGLMVTFIGGVAWLTELKFRGDANASEIKDVRSDQMQSQKTLKKIEKWLAAIGQKLDIPEPPGGE